MTFGEKQKLALKKKKKKKKKKKCEQGPRDLTERTSIFEKKN